MDTRSVAQEMRLGHWTNIMRERKSSGLSVRSWCRENGCNEKTYYYWQRKLREAACTELVLRHETAIVDAPSFAEVKIPVEGKRPGVITVRMGETVVEVSGDASTEAVETVLRTLSQL